MRPRFALDIDLVTGGTRGLCRDGEVLRAVLCHHASVAHRIARARNGHALLQRWGRRLQAWATGRRPLVICAEILPTAWADCAGQLVLIPNQEWLRPEVEQNLPRCDAVFCKTRYAQQVFEQRGFAARYIGFSSADLLDRDVPKDYERFIHIAGRSDLKGTAVLLRTWRQHPEWPKLQVVSSRAEFLAEQPAANIELLGGHCSDAELGRLANAAGVHVCLSETEGFGHYIAEAMSTEALTVVTDAPPMHELVDSDCAVLAVHAERKPMSWSERFLVSEAGVTAAIEQVLALSPSARRTMGLRARQRYLQARVEFETRLVIEVQALIQRA